MNRISQLLAAAFIGVITVSTQAAAQKSYALGIGGGVAIPVGKLSDTQKSGINGLVSLALGVADLPIGIRIDGIYNELPRNEAMPPVGSPGTSNLRIVGVLGNAVYAFSGTSVKTYLIAGGGLYNTRFDADDSKSENHFGLNAGAGMTFGFGPIASFIESRYHFISRQPDKGGVLHYVPITFGFMF
jgi:hypothetical protein